MEDDMIEVTGVDLRKLVQEVYALSRPQGLGHLHYEKGGLSDEETNALIDCEPRGRVILSLDYLKGRACKFHVRREDDKLFISPRWYDHSADDLKELLKRVGLESKAGEVRDGY